MTVAQYSLLHIFTLCKCCLCKIALSLSCQSTKIISVFHSDNLNPRPTHWTTVPLNLVGLKKKTASIMGISVPVPTFWIVQTMTIGNPFCFASARSARASRVSIPQWMRTTEIEGFLSSIFLNCSASATRSVKTREQVRLNSFVYLRRVAICFSALTISFMAQFRSSL